MVKYVDTGLDTSAAKGKKVKKGFKSDRLENYKKMLAKKSGKNVKEAPSHTPRQKTLSFDDSSRRDYLLTLHKKKNERRVQAFVDMKRKQRKENSKTRREQREEARRAYNNYAKVPILPDYSYRLPLQEDEGFADDEEDEISSVSSASTAAEEENTPWVCLGEDEKETGATHTDKKRRHAKRLATVAHSKHSMPSAMVGGEEEGEGGAVDDDVVTVEVKPLFPRHPVEQGEGKGKEGTARRPALPNNDYGDLPEVVQQELRRLRAETKGPAKTKPRLHMMKELEKIRKIRKHSRKGHGKRKASGKRKNRK